MKNTFLTFLSFFITFYSFAQLSKIHYIPPIFTVSGDNVNDHRLFLSTPNKKSFYVKIYEGNNLFIDSVKVSKEAPNSYKLGDMGNPRNVFYDLKYLNKPLKTGGLRLEADYSFYVNLRNNARAHGASLTSKGVAGLGKEFRTGHMFVGFYSDNATLTSHFISVMATQNNTIVNVSDITMGVNFYGKVKRKKDSKTTANFQFKLNKGESYIIAERAIDYEVGNQNNSFGTKLLSNKPIAVNCGTTVGVNPTGLPGWDNGFDQIVPINVIGDEYVLVRGEGIDDIERPMIIAAYDKTKIIINGEVVKKKKTKEQKKNKLDADDLLLNAGEYYVVDGSRYTKKYENMHIKSNKSFYMFQTAAGGIETLTCGLNFVPPLTNCQNFDEVVISDVGFLGEFALVNVVTKVGAKVQFIDYETGEVLKTFKKEVSNLVEGTNDSWISYRYRIPMDVDNVLVKSDQVINVSLNNNSQFKGSSSYFSGFIPEPYIFPLGGKASYYSSKHVELNIGNHEVYDSFEWYKNGSFLKETKSPLFDIKEPGKYFVKCSSIGCGNEFITDTFEIEKPELLATVEPEEIFEPDPAPTIKNFIKQNKVGAPVLVPLNFQSASEKLVASSKPILEDIIIELTKYPNVKIEIRAHSDCRGGDDYNMKLSQRRANYIKSYMVDNGIEAKRLVAKGFGETKPIIACDCEVNDACPENVLLMNRRSEFVIIE